MDVRGPVVGRVIDRKSVPLPVPLMDIRTRKKQHQPGDEIRVEPVGSGPDSLR